MGCTGVYISFDREMSAKLFLGYSFDFSGRWTGGRNEIRGIVYRRQCKYYFTEKIWPLFLMAGDSPGILNKQPTAE
jgi:hypothetical protein